MRPPRVGLNVAVSTANVVAVVGASLLAVPLLIDRLGLAGYGLWTLAQSLVIYITTAELGFGPAIARFTSVHRGHRDDLDEVKRIMLLALASYALVGFVVVLACRVLAGPLVEAFPVPDSFRDDAVATVRLMGWVAFAALIGAPLAHVMSGLERFLSLTLTNVAGSLAFLTAIAFGVRSGTHLEDVARAALLQWSIVAVTRLVVVRDLLRPHGRLLPERALIRQLVGFSARLQIAVLATLLNTQTDRVVIGLVASAATLGQAGIATQVAEAGRFLAYAAFTPMASRMATVYGADGREELATLFVRHRHTWIKGLLGVTAVTIGAVPALITAWIGAGHGEAASFAILLLLAYGVGLLLSPEFCYLRALGDARLEGRFGVLTVALNVCATIILGLTFGAGGVIAGTTIGYLTATIWAAVRARRLVPRAPMPPGSLLKAIGMALGAGAATLAASQELLDLLPRLLALVGIGALAAAALAVHLAVTLGRQGLARPAPSG